MNAEQTKEIIAALETLKSAIVLAAGAIDKIKLSLTAPAATESLVDKFRDRFEATRPQAKPIQLKLPLGAPVVHRGRLGDIGFEDEANPVRQAVGQIGGLATAGVVRAKSPDRRKRGTVMVKDMAVNEKRRYWRWAKDRADARHSGRRPPTWAEWVANGDRAV